MSEPPLDPASCEWGFVLSLHSSGSATVPFILEDTMRVDLVEMLAQSTNFDDRSSPPGDRLIGVVSDLSRDLKSTQQNVPRSCAAGHLRFFKVKPLLPRPLRPKNPQGCE